MRDPGAQRSGEWFAGDDLAGMLHRWTLRAQGLTRASFDGRPVIGICSSWSELVHCNVHFRALANHVRRGVQQAGGVALELDTVSLSEGLMKPTTMLYRNLMAMEVEECLRAHPFDAVVLIGGCDKTVPAQLMGAASADVPAIALTGGPSLSARLHGREIGSGTDFWRYADDYRAGRIERRELDEFEAAVGPSVGHCPEMGTASTMAVLVEAMGFSLPGSAMVPAVDARRAQVAERTGARAVELAREGLRPSAILTEQALENAITMLAAVGGSTNAVIHLLALAGRLGIALPLERFDQLAARTPTIVNLRPSGEHLSEQLFQAGGVPAVLRELAPLLHLDAPTVTGRPLRDALAAADASDRTTIAALEQPFRPAGGLAVLRGNLAPDGALLKVSVASEALLRHSGAAVVFEDMEDLAARIEDPALEVDTSSVLILRNVGPVGAPGMPEWGQIPIPRRLIEVGVRDMVRISDARMSGTAYGTVVLHVTPEAAVGGPLALVRSGDRVTLDVPRRALELEVADDELARRREAWRPRPPHYERGYGALHAAHVLQADQGCDLDFLRGRDPRAGELPLGMLRGWIGGW